MLLLEVLSVAAGCALLLLLTWDVAVTILHPAARGPVSTGVDRGVWTAIQRLAGERGGRRVLSFGGPLAVLLTFGLWLFGVGLAYTLVYWPFVDRFVSASGQPREAGGFLEALYLSGTALSTVGFGDVVAQSAALRLVTVLESLSGLVAVTAGITYLLSLNPYVLGTRGRAVRLAELGAADLEGAARLAAQGGAAAVADVHAALVEAHENVRRFPVLFLFEPRDPEASILTVLRAATSMCLVLRWGTRDGALPFAELYGDALASTLARMRRDFAHEFPTLAPPDGDGEDPDRPGLDERFARLRAAVAAGAPGHEAQAPNPPAGLGAFLDEVDPFLAGLSRVYRYEARPLV